MKKILYIGRFFSPNILKWISEDARGKVGFSNHNFEMSLINGLIKHKDVELNILSLPSIYSYPQNSSTFYVKSEEYFIDNVPIYSVGFCNLFFLNKFTSTFRLLLAIVKYISSDTSGEEISIIINTPKANLLTAVLLSKLLIRKQISVTLIIPDIPSMITKFNVGNFIKKKIQNCIDSYSLYLASKCNYFVFLTEAMKSFFKSDIKYTVVEGLIDTDSDINDKEKLPNDKSVILYTGTLNRFFGINKLLDAFEMLDRNDVELWICGSGDTSSEIEARSRKNSKIIFRGLVDINTARQLQRQADILINPRGSEGEFTKYSFPSKTMEYLLTGNVVIINKLPGIPIEYYDYVICPRDESVESMAEAINNVLDMGYEERRKLGNSGREFILKKKNSYVQVGKILDMMFRGK